MRRTPTKTATQDAIADLLDELEPNPANRRAAILRIHALIDALRVLHVAGETLEDFTLALSRKQGE